MSEADLEPIARELIAMAEEDRRVRAELVADGTLFDGYSPRMEAVHLANGARLEAIVAAHGWPGRRLVGDEASRAAWLVLQHAISRPDLQRRGVGWLSEAVAASEVPALELAYLEDRVAFFEGRPQRYGTQSDWDEAGRMSVWTLEDPERVDEWRHAVGLGPLVERPCAGGEMEPEPPPRDWETRRREFLAWCRQVGWRS